MCSPQPEDKQRFARREKVPAFGTKWIAVGQDTGGYMAAWTADLEVAHLSVFRSKHHGGCHATL